MADPSPIPVVGGPPNTNVSNPGSGSSSSGGTGSKKSGGGGGGGGDPYLRNQRKQQRKASQRYMDDAAALRGQVRALRRALNGGFRRALDIRLANIGLVTGQQQKQVMQGYRERVGSLAGAAKDNEKAAAGQGFLNLSNRGRERANALSEAMLQGAGESDILRSQEMSLRNWNANQGEVNRGFFDTLRTVNSSLTDLNVDTKTARMNLAAEANADREQLYNSFYAQRAEALTQLGNVLGQQGEYYGLANEQVGSKKARRLRNRAENLSDAAFLGSANMQSKAWKNPGISARLRKWQGRDDFSDGGMGDSTYREAASQTTNLARPEGATLRSWT